MLKKTRKTAGVVGSKMQYYNGSMYGCSGDSYGAGTVQGSRSRRSASNTGWFIQGPRSGFLRPAGSGRRPVGCRRRVPVAGAGHPVLELIGGKLQGPDDLGDPRGRLHGLDLSRQLKGLQGRCASWAGVRAAARTSSAPRVTGGQQHFTPASSSAVSCPATKRPPNNTRPRPNGRVAQSRGTRDPPDSGDRSRRLRASAACRARRAGRGPQAARPS